MDFHVHVSDWVPCILGIDIKTTKYIFYLPPRSQTCGDELRQSIKRVIVKVRILYKSLLWCHIKYKSTNTWSHHNDGCVISVIWKEKKNIKELPFLYILQVFIITAKATYNDWMIIKSMMLQAHDHPSPSILFYLYTWLLVSFIT